MTRFSHMDESEYQEYCRNSRQLGIEYDYDKESDLEEFLATAERKLNKSKRNGKNQASV